MNRETAFFIANLNKAHDIRIEIQPNCPNNPIIIVDELELAIFKKYIIMALREIQKT